MNNFLSLKRMKKGMGTKRNKKNKKYNFRNSYNLASTLRQFFLLATSSSNYKEKGKLMNEEKNTPWRLWKVIEQGKIIKL